MTWFVGKFFIFNVSRILVVFSNKRLLTGKKILQNDKCFTFHLPSSNFCTGHLWTLAYFCTGIYLALASFQIFGCEKAQFDTQQALKPFVVLAETLFFHNWKPCFTSHFQHWPCTPS